MVETPGICTQTTTCEMARSGRSVTIPLGMPFTCPDCGRGLVPPVQATEPPPVQKMPIAVPMALVGAGLLLLGGAVFLGNELGSSVSEAPRPIAAAAPISAGPASASPAPASAQAPPAAIAAAEPLPQVSPPRPAVEPPPAPAGQLSGLPPTPPAATAPTATAPAPSATLADRAPAPLADAAPVAPAPASASPPRLVLRDPEPAPVIEPAPPPAASPLPPDQPFSAVPVSGGAPAYPAELAVDGRVGRVAVTCQIQADGTPAGCRAGAARGSAVFATAALAWLGHGHVRFRPIILRGRAVAAVRSWTVAIEEPAAALAEARRRQAEAKAALAQAAPASASPAPPAAAVPAAPNSLRVEPVIARAPVAPPVRPAGTDRAFSARVVSGGAPAYPAIYDEGRTGAVTVSCTIGQTGSPTGCHVLQSRGGKGFSQSVQAWLGSGGVRFRPVLAGGQPVSHEESWTILFNGTAPDERN